MMIFEDLMNVIENTKYPVLIPEDMSIGERIYDERNDKLFEFFPNNYCSAFSSVRQYQDTAEVIVHTHGIEVNIDGICLYIHNFQVIVFDYFYLDETIEYKKADSRGARIGAGLILAGPMGAIVGLATSFGKGRKHIKSNNILIAYWNIETKQKEIILLENKEETSRDTVSKLIECWNEQKKLNEETGRKPLSGYNSGITSSGCLISFISVSFFLGIYACYKLFDIILGT